MTEQEERNAEILQAANSLNNTAKELYDAWAASAGSDTAYEHLPPNHITAWKDLAEFALARQWQCQYCREPLTCLTCDETDIRFAYRQIDRARDQARRAAGKKLKDMPAKEGSQQR